MAFREWRHHDEGHPEAQLIEVGAEVPIRSAGREARADALRVRRTEEAVCAASALRARGRVGGIGALTRTDAVGGPRSALRSSRWRDVIVEAAVLVVGDEEDRALPAGAVAQGADHL